MRNFTILFALFFNVVFAFAQRGDSSVVFNQKIEWSLFKGVPDSDTLGARISTSMYLEISKVNVWTGAITFKACAIMNPYYSWVKTGYANQYTLQHEQTHFNLTEICARGLQSELNNMKLKSRRSPNIESIFAKWQKKLGDLQRQYDFDTKGGNDNDAQKTWNEKVIADLN